MFIVGIDLSINAPAFCICEDFDNFEFVGFINNPKISNVNLQYILTEAKKYDGMELINISQSRVTSDTYHVNERMKMLNFNRIISAIVLEIRKRVGAAPVIIAMEGISYGSKGSALVDICMLTGALRRAMLNELLGGADSRFFVFSPSELKNAIGVKGNATKTEVLAQFLEEPGIPAIQGCGMQRFMSDHITGLTASEYVYKEKADEICSPFNDMIDAYLSVLKIRQGMS